MASIPAKRRKIQNVLDEACEDAVKIIEQAAEASRDIVTVLSGLAEKDTAVDGIITQFKKLLELLDDIETLEGNY